MPAKGLNKDRPTDDSHPFGKQWLDSCYQETLLPNGPWQQVNEKICEELAEKVKKQLDIPARKQMLFELLGQGFVSSYFPNETFKPALIAPPAMSSESRKKLQIDAQNWLQNAINKIALETGSMRSIQAEQSGVGQSQEVQDFLKHTGFIFTKGMNRMLFLQEQEIEKQWEEVKWQKQEAKLARQDARERARLRQEYERLRGVNSGGVRSILRTMVAPSTADSTATSVTSNIKGAMHGLTDDPPAIWGIQSNALGRSVISILKRDPRRFGEVVAKLHGRQLPASLRTYIWMDVLLRHERQKLSTPNIEKIVRERFGKAVARGVGELRISRATHSPISSLIDNAVIEIYNKTPAMKMFVSEEPHVKESAKGLNILYVYDRSYEPYLVYWLFPLQLAFQDTAGQSEHTYELAMFLDLLNKSCFPKWPQIFAIAEKALNSIKVMDEELFEHLKKVGQIDPTVNPKEFMIQLIHEEKTQAEKILNARPGSKKSDMSIALLADPLVFIRRWVGEAFVGILDTQAAIYVWDQCFMQKWDTKVIEDFTVVLLLLLRHKFLATTNYQEMRSVFLNEACKLYTIDIQRAWIHIQNQGELDQVPYFNRQRPLTALPATASLPGSSRRPASVAPSEVSMEMLSAGMKDIKVKLVLPSEALVREKWLQDLDRSRMRLSCILYFGDVDLAMQHSNIPPILRKEATDKYGVKTCLYMFSKQKFIFDRVDVSKYDLERAMDAIPYAVIKVEYFKPDHNPDADALAAPLVLGETTKMLVYRKDPHMGSSQFGLTTGAETYKLYPIPPAKQNSDSPQLMYGDLVGDGSEINAVIFDPNDEPPSGTVTPFPLHHTPTPTPRPSTKASIANMPGINDPFDLYIDGLDGIPDSASIVKVTGRIIKTGDIPSSRDVLAFPELSKSARNPRFKYQQLMNESKASADPGMMLLLRVYTVDMDTFELVVIGSCLYEVFDPETQLLKVGGHRRALYQGMPDLKHGIEPLRQTSLDDDHILIPACYFYFRLAEHTDGYTKAPELISANYTFEHPPTNASAKKVAASYSTDGVFPQTEKLMIEKLKQLEGITEDSDLDEWRRQRLDNTKQLPNNVPAPNLDQTRYVQYRIGVGLNVKIASAYNLPQGLYFNCFGRVAPGKYSANFQTTTEGWGGLDKLITLKHNLDSPQSAPQWIDSPTEMHPHADANSLVIIQIFGIDAVYTPDKQHAAPGTVQAKKNKRKLQLGDEQTIGWTVLALFEKNYVLNGIHHLPVFKGNPPEDVLQALTEDIPENVFKDHKSMKNLRIPGAALVVQLWDNHFKQEHMPTKLAKYDFLLDAVGKKEEYEQAEKKQKGPNISQFVVNILPSKEKKKGTDSELYSTEARYYTDVMSEEFYQLMESALLAAGYGPLPDRRT